MGKGRDLTTQERAIVNPKIKQYWNQKLTTIEINKKVDSEFYHNMFCQPGGAFDMIGAKMPWLRGREFKIQQDGARSHTGTNSVEELQDGGTGDGWVPIT